MHPSPPNSGQAIGGEAAIEVLEPYHHLISLRPRLISPTQSCTISRISVSLQISFQAISQDGAPWFNEGDKSKRTADEEKQWGCGRADKAASSRVELRHRNARGLRRSHSPLPGPRGLKGETAGHWV